MSLVGQQLGHYRIVRLIGQGGMGEVYLAEDTRIARQVAIKVIRSERQAYPDTEALQQAKRLFQREMKAISLLDHPNILGFYDFGEEPVANNATIYMVMPYRPEGSLVDWLLRRGPVLLPPQDIVRMLAQAASALQHAHDHHIIHQDVKPSNFLVRVNADHPTYPDLFLVDFGIARVMSATSTASNNVRGTATYMAPEQWSGDVGPAADQYALAIMAYQLLTGQPPFQGRSEQVMFQHLTQPPKPPSAMNARLSPALDAVILRALAKKPDERFPTIRAFAVALQQALDYTDLRATLAVTRTEALQGINRTITLPGKRQVTVMVPPNAQHGQVLHLQGQGMPYYDGGPHGPLLLTLSTAQTEAIELPAAADKHFEPPIPASSGSAWQRPPTPDANAETVASSSLGATPLPDMPVLAPPPPPSRGSVPPPPASLPTHRNSLSNRRTILLVALASLLIVSGLLAVVFVNNIIATNNAHATATAQSVADDNATGTALAQATNDAATAIVQARATNAAATAQAIAQATSAAATAQAQATANTIAANPDPYSPAGTLALVDPLSHAFIWGYSSNTSFGGLCHFVNGAYQASQSPPSKFFLCGENNTYSNFAFEVKMTINQGDCGGMVVRSNSNFSLYLFQICQDGSYDFYKYTSAAASSSIVLTGGRASAFNQGLGRQNTIAVVANGSSFALYVNRQRIDGVSDTAYNQGYIGLIASARTSATTVTYQDARVWTIS